MKWDCRFGVVLGLLALFATGGTITEPLLANAANGDAPIAAVRGRLGSVRVATQYRHLTDGASINRSSPEAIALLKALHTDFIFQGWVTEWQPLVTTCSNLPSPAQRVECERAGYSYQRLEEAVRRVKEAMPEAILGGGLLVEFLYPETFDPITGEQFDRERAWALALDPREWGLSLGKGNLQRFLAARVYHWTDDDPAHYDPRREMRAFFPDITKPQFQKLFLDLAKKQINLGVDVLWIDGLFAQAKCSAGARPSGRPRGRVRPTNGRR